MNPKDHATVHDLAVTLGVSDRTIERWWAAGKLPKPEKIGSQGAKLWSGAQVKEIRKWRMSQR